MRIVVKFPTRGRAKQAWDVIDQMVGRLSGLHDVRFIVVLDEDDPDRVSIEHSARMRSPGTIGNGYGGCTVQVDPTAQCGCCCPPTRGQYIGKAVSSWWVDIRVGKHAHKIEACNAFTPPIDEWDILVMGSDDMWPAIDGWDDRIASDMARIWPNFDGCLWYSDGNQMGLCTYPIYGVNWYAKVGAVYPGEYQSLYADDEAHQLAMRVGRIEPVYGVVVFEHRHPAYHAAVAKDDLYERNDLPAAKDRALFASRREQNFDWPEHILLSIGICSVERRAESLQRLLAELNRQVNGLFAGLRRLVEIVVDIDAGQAAGGLSVGAKRQRILKRAQGKYICFIDDDDMVTPDYVASIVSALEFGPLDCVTFDVERRVDGLVSGDNDLRGGWVKYPIRLGCPWPGGAWERPVNHLCPVKRELALACGGFDPEKAWGEDMDYAQRLGPLLKSEARIDRTLYIYHDVPANSETRRFGPVEPEGDWARRQREAAELCHHDDDGA